MTNASHLPPLEQPLEHSLKLHLEQAHYLPNSQLRGNVHSSESITLCLRWRAEGRCDPSSIVVEQLELPAGQHTFSFTLPSEPESYDGLLFRYLWEIVAHSGDAEKVLSFRVTAQKPKSNPHHDAYQQVGLKHNPFIVDDAARTGKSRLDYQHGWRGVADNLWLERGYSQAPEPAGKQLVQLLGVKGAGKSSHLKHWQKQTGGSYRYYPPDWQRFYLPPLEPICYWDEADRIPKPLLYLAFALAARRGCTICAGTHVNLAASARFFGLQVRTIHLESISAKDIEQWVAKRLAAVALTEDITLPLAADYFEELARAAQGSWRTIAKELHVWVARYVAQAHKNV